MIILLLFYNLLYSIVKMGNYQFQIPDNMSRQWIKDIQDKKQVFINKITRQQFELIDISKKQFRLNYRLLIQRSTYIIPKTPKIILLKNLKGKTCILVQSHDEPLSKYIPKIVIVADLLQLIKEITQVVRCLFQKYGAFMLTDKMMGVNKNMQILIWINEVNYKTQVQFPLESSHQIEYAMISLVIKMIRQHSSFSLKYDVLSNPPQNFQTFLFALNELINHQKIMRKPLHTRQAFRRAFSPQSFPQQKSKQIHRIAPLTMKKQLIFNKQASKINRIPSFIKAIKQNKTYLLRSLRHKTAVSIDDSKCFKNDHSERNSPPYNQFKSLDKLKSPKGLDTPKSGYDVSSCKIEKNYRSNSKGETAQPLTASGTSSSNMAKKKPGLDKDTFKINIQQMPQSNKQFQPSSTGISSYLQKEESSLLFRSVHKIPQSLKQPMPLVSLCPNTSESKYFDTNCKIEELFDEQSKNKSNSKTIEQQFGQMFSNPPKSPRNYFDVSPESTELMEEFGKIMNIN